MQSVASVLTIPLTSAVCSCAAVAYLQQPPSRGRRPTLRQTLAIANKGWADPSIIYKLVSGGWGKYGSVFLVATLLLNGALVMPIQNLVVSSKTIKVQAPTDQGRYHSIHVQDLAKVINEGFELQGQGRYPLAMLRSRLAAATNMTPQFRLWSRSLACDQSSSKLTDPVCLNSGQSTFGNMWKLDDPFWAFPPAGLDTGLYRQFSSRVSFRSSYEHVGADSYQAACKDIGPESLFLHHEDLIVEDGYALDVCMPGNASMPLWKAQYSPQKFHEELYLRIKIIGSGFDKFAEGDRYRFAGLFQIKATLETTGGYFQLPNYLDNHTRAMHMAVFHRTAEGDPNKATEELKSFGATNNSVYWLRNPGPLMATTLALFGNGSMLDPGATRSLCITNTYPPFHRLMGENERPLYIDNPCKYFDWYPDQPEMTTYAIRNYLANFAANSTELARQDEEALPFPAVRDSLSAAAFVAVDVWHEAANRASVMIDSRLGNDLQIPSISCQGVIVASALLGVFLCSLLCLSIYSALTPRWTNKLDSFAMLRIGAFESRHFPLYLSNNVDMVEALDKLPGWIGTAESGTPEKPVALELGGPIGLKKQSRYRAYRAV
ncbi:hypothetical protein IF2G_02719 [Cordyceps javanica]|nr:hypothetical protein IF2G_02719 [Cordyceps javanica]